MEEASNSHSSFYHSLQVTSLPSTNNSNAVDCDQSCLEAEISAPLSPMENPGHLALLVPSSEGNADFLIEIALNSCSLKSLSDCETICAAPCDTTQEKKVSSSSDVLEIRSTQKGDCLFGAAKGTPKESSGSVVPEMRAVLKETTGKLSERVDAVPRSLEIELIDDTAVIGIEMDTTGRRNVKKEQTKKERKPRRRSKAAKTDSDENKNCSNLKVSTVISSRNKRTEKPKKIVYSRKAMETLRYRNLKGQRKLWHRIYNVFPSTMKIEYEEMGCSSDQNKQSGTIWDTNRAPPVLGMAATTGGFLNDYARQENYSEFLWGRRNFV